MLHDTAKTDARSIEVYWMPGCSACLRLKEFVEATGLEYTAINLDATPGQGEKLIAHGLPGVPAICVGDECVPGVELGAVAELLGVPYTKPIMLTPSELTDRYLSISGVLSGLIEQIEPDIGLYKPEGRDRDLLELAGHAATLMRYFLGIYSDDDFGMDFSALLPDARDAQALCAVVAETQTMFQTWWVEDGQSDPLNRVVVVYWGPRTLHEALEREVWHAAQHTRQIAYLLEMQGVEPSQRLSQTHLAGLPIPERIFE